MKSRVSFRVIPAVCFMFLSSVFLWGDNSGSSGGSLPLAEDFTAYLGWLPAEAHQWLGAPENLFVYRGNVSAEDNVVYYYSNHIYLFWFGSRVWQVRADERWKGSVDGVNMGMTRKEVEKLWGPPVNSFDAQPTWLLPDRGYPVRIRLYFDEQGRLNDLYVYRSDW